MVSDTRFLRSLYASWILCFSLVVSFSSLSLDSLARSLDLLISMMVFSISRSAFCLSSSAFLSASALTFSICVNLSRMSLVALLVFSSILSSFSLYSRSDGPVTVFSRLFCIICVV